MHRCGQLGRGGSRLAARLLVTPAAGHRYNVFALAGRVWFPFVCGGAAFGGVPTRSGLSTRAGRAPLVLEQLLLFKLPSVFKFHALVVLFVFGEVEDARGKI